ARANSRQSAALPSPAPAHPPWFRSCRQSASGAPHQPFLLFSLSGEAPARRTSESHGLPLLDFCWVQDSSTWGAGWVAGGLTLRAAAAAVVAVRSAAAGFFAFASSLA